MGRRSIRSLPATLAICMATLSAAGAAAKAASRIEAFPPAGGTTATGGLVGCTSRPGAVVESGPPRRQVALTFDDGPSLTQTPEILETLDRLGAVATFFEEGRHVKGREQLMAEILARGDEIGNHTYHHPLLPGPREIASTETAIHAATGFRPCLFRPSYGLLDRGVRSAAAGSGLETVLWDVDSGDDRHPGVAAIRRRVLKEAHPGAIVLMHDGGHHPQTVRALPGIVRGLRARGYGFATVTELLGGRFVSY